MLQQRAAGEVPLHEPRHVCLLMHVGAAQARTRLQERLNVLPASQVREMPAARASYDALSPEHVGGENLAGHPGSRQLSLRPDNL